MSSRAEWLAKLEARSAGEASEDLLLWPRTPVAEIQARIRERVGVSDVDVDDPRSRPASVLRELGRRIDGGILTQPFSLLDIACGDALVLRAVKRRFPEAECLGVDLLKGEFSSHQDAEAEGVRLFRVPIQRLFESLGPPAPFDVALMLNTYRGWESADLRPHERALPRLADRWLDGHARVAILTVTARQLVRLRLKGHAVRVIGPGEDRSRMVAVTVRR
jgi:hypothetical protein